jgi:integrase
MADIRKRNGKKGTTYLVRYPSKARKCGYEHKSFDTMKEARQFVEVDLSQLKRTPRHGDSASVDDAIKKWLETCRHEGRQGKDPVSPATAEVYEYRAEIMKAYNWDKALQELETPDIVAFRSWLLKNYSRDQAKKTLSSFHSVLLEMVTQGVLATDPAARITIQQSRYQEPVEIPSVEEVQSILRAADALASHKNYWIEQAWARYRPMIFLAADSGMRPQEYLALADSDVLEKGIRITQALDRSNRIGPPKSRAGRRYIPVGAETLEVVRAYRKGRKSPTKDGLLFPGETGGHQRYNNYLRRGWHVLMEHASMIDVHSVDGQKVTEARYTPYSLRHFYASMLISQKRDLKTIQERMGHEDAAMTLNVYGHLIRQRQAEDMEEEPGVLSHVRASCDKSAANII